MARRFQSLMLVLLVTSVSASAPVRADFDNSLGALWRQAMAMYASEHRAAGDAMAATMVEMLGLPPEVARNPGSFLDAVLESAVDVGPTDADMPVRMGEFLWGTVASGDNFGLCLSRPPSCTSRAASAPSGQARFLMPCAGSRGGCTGT